MVSWHVCVNLILPRLWDLIFHFFFLLITYNKTTIQVALQGPSLNTSNDGAPSSSPSQAWDKIIKVSPGPYACLKFNGRGRACSPFQGHGIEYFLLYGRGILDVRGGHTWTSRVWLCSYAATSSLESSEVSLAVLTQRLRIQAFSVSAAQQWKTSLVTRDPIIQVIAMPGCLFV